MMSEKYVTVSAVAFTGQSRRTHRCTVGTDGAVLVWDSVAGHYTACHILSAAALRRARILASTAK